MKAAVAGSVKIGGGAGGARKRQATQWKHLVAGWLSMPCVALAFCGQAGEEKT
jgi:hypothetical protein